jgi:hypothetical protein
VMKSLRLRCFAGVRSTPIIPTLSIVFVRRQGVEAAGGRD